MGPDGQSHMPLKYVFVFFKLAFDYLKMKYVMGEVHRDNSTIKPAEKA